MDVPTLILWLVVAALLPLAWRRRRLREALSISLDMAGLMAPRVLLALLAAGFLAVLMPGALVADWVGTDSGWRGILIGALCGGLIPGGPMVSFPFVVALAKAGAGWPQLAALLTAWSVVALHRFFAWELPMLGFRFSARRLLASILLPPLAGLTVAALLPWWTG